MPIERAFECYKCFKPLSEKRVVKAKEGYAVLCDECWEENVHRMTGFPERYTGLHLASIISHDGNKRAVEMANRWINGGLNLFFYGSPGTGKTHLACAAMSDAKTGKRKFVSIPIMFLGFQSGVKDHEEMELIKKYTAITQGGYEDGPTRFLFDDVGAHRTSEFCLEMFGIILDTLYSENRTDLIFTSNLSPKQILETMGERIASRLQGLAEPVKLEGKDMRLK